MNLAQKIKYSTIAFTATFLSLSTVAQAAGESRDYLTGYVGYFDVIDNDPSSAQFGIEYRARPLQFAIRPIVGLSVTGDNAIYGYAGVNWDAELITNQLYLIPNFAVGLYKRGDGKELGGMIEFRSGIELAYQFPNAHRLGIAFNHLSNASMYGRNPGTEVALITYSIPTDNFR